MNIIAFITVLLTASLVLCESLGGKNYQGDYDNQKYGNHDDDDDDDDYSGQKYGGKKNQKYYGDDDDDDDDGDDDDDDDDDYEKSYSYESFTCEQYTSVYKSLDDFITNKTNAAFAIQGLVRLSFHDCVGKSCDGCLNPKDSNNKGLEFRSSLDAIYNKYFTHVLSRADYYALAGHVALIRGLYNTKCTQDKYCPSLFLDWRWGRKDCPNSPNTPTIDGFPDSHGDFSEVTRVLNGMFGLNPVETVALMGGHSLGGAHVQFSGFNYNWQVNDVVFNNAYYINLLAHGFVHENVGNKTYASRRFEFVRPNVNGVNLLMLNADLSLLKYIIAEKDSKGAFSGQVHCDTQKEVTEIYQGAVNQILECDQAPTASVVVAYANDLQLFYNDFSTAWFKMVSNGYPLSGQYALYTPNASKGQVCGTCVPKGSTCAAGYSLSGACCKGYSCKNKVCR